MHTSTPTRLKLAATTTLAAIVIMAALFLHGTAAANTQPPPQPSNPLADVITGQGPGTPGEDQLGRPLRGNRGPSHGEPERRAEF